MTDTLEIDIGDDFVATIELRHPPNNFFSLEMIAGIADALESLDADFRMAAPEARFSANFARLGFHQGFGLSVTLPRLVGPQVAADLLYTGRRVPGEEAARLGLADGLVARDKLRDAAHGMAREIAMSAPLAVRSIRATLRGDLADQVEAAVAHEHREQDRLQRTADFAEGSRAMAERRIPEFRGE